MCEALSRHVRCVFSGWGGSKMVAGRAEPRLVSSQRCVRVENRYGVLFTASHCILPHQYQLGADEAEGMRYWAAVGRRPSSYLQRRLHFVRPPDASEQANVVESSARLCIRYY